MISTIIVLSLLVVFVNGMRLRWKRLAISLRDLINEQIKEIQRLRKKKN